MIDGHYPLIPAATKLDYLFFSIGKQGKVLKFIEFVQIPTGEWNLAFGDVVHGAFNDRNITNNHDLQLVMKTVIFAAYQFSESFPDRIIQVVPVDDRRRTLYNTILKRHLDEIAPVFIVLGETEGALALFDPKNTYEKFYFHRRKQSF